MNEEKENSTEELLKKLKTLLPRYGNPSTPQKAGIEQEVYEIIDTLNTSGDLFPKNFEDSPLEIALLAKNYKIVAKIISMATPKDLGADRDERPIPSLRRAMLESNFMAVGGILYILQSNEHPTFEEACKYIVKKTGANPLNLIGEYKEYIGLNRQELSDNEKFENRQKLKALNAAITQKGNRRTHTFASNHDKVNIPALDAEIAGYINDLPPVYLLSREFEDKETDMVMRAYDYVDSPLHKAIKNNDNEIAKLILTKESVTSKHLQRGSIVPSIEQAIAEANEEIAMLIMQKLDPKMQAKYKDDIIMAFGEESLPEHTQSQPPAKKSQEIKRG